MNWLFRSAKPQPTQPPPSQERQINKEREEEKTRNESKPNVSGSGRVED
jgi:hypothetical protein